MKKEKECKKAPDGKHCWHDSNVHIQTSFCENGKLTTSEIISVCCWCNKKKKEVKQSKHGLYEPVACISY